MSNELRQVTSVNEWRERSQPLVDITGFEPGEYLTVRLKSVSLLDLVKTGKIPNALLEEATKLFNGSRSESGAIDESKIITQLGDSDRVMNIIDTVVKSALVEPAFEEIKDFITDAQKMEIFSWTQGGVESLKYFRKE